MEWKKVMNKDIKLDWDEIQNIQKELKEKIKNDPWRLRFHQMPETGWLNDPNGVVQFQGKYHLYHQYDPISPTGGLVHWGHKTSDDLVHFKEEEIFLSPDKIYNQSGAFSGSAFIKDDELHFFYTGNVKQPGDHDYTFSGREQNTIHLVSKDGFTIDFEEVVIPHEDYPEGYTDHIRDPKVFEKNGTYYMILGARQLNHRGSILLYESDNLSDWTFKGTFLEANTEDMGYMFECPDYFTVDGHDVLIYSPQGILKDKKYKYQNIFQSGFHLGTTNWDEMKFEIKNEFEELDYGFDFYAPQTFEDESGRRILWGWMGLSNTAPEYSNPTVARGWQHAMALPRELRVIDNRLVQLPLVEYEQLRKNERKGHITVDNSFDLPMKQQDAFELKLENINAAAFTIALKEDTELSYDGKIFKLKHGVSGYGRSTRGVVLEETLESLQVFVDTSSIEIFINGGLYVLTSRVYPKMNKDYISFTGEGEMDFKIWDLQI